MPSDLLNDQPDRQPQPKLSPEEVRAISEEEQNYTELTKGQPKMLRDYYLGLIESGFNHEDAVHFTSIACECLWERNLP